MLFRCKHKLNVGYCEEKNLNCIEKYLQFFIQTLW